jgi:hypothetical protein
VIGEPKRTDLLAKFTIHKLFSGKAESNHLFQPGWEALARRARLPGKAILFHIVPLDLAYATKAGRGTFRSNSLKSGSHPASQFHGVAQITKRSLHHGQGGRHIDRFCHLSHMADAEKLSHEVAEPP